MCNEETAHCEILRCFSKHLADTLVLLTNSIVQHPSSVHKFGEIPLDSGILKQCTLPMAISP